VPRYDYRCNGCGHVYEKREGFDAPSVQECPVCNGEARRLLTPPAIVFKGSGWYVNDSRKSSAGTDRSDAAPSESKTETKSETKAETKSESAGAATAAAAD
jgi:putative FmdB family regulatory protein